VSDIEVFQEADGRWRWEYRDDKIDLKSNRTYSSSDSALEAASIAYPDVFSPQPPPRAQKGFLGAIAKVLTFALVVVVWRRRGAR
jgi:hypothetical protein